MLHGSNIVECLKLTDLKPSVFMTKKSIFLNIHCKDEPNTVKTVCSGLISADDDLV